MRSFRIPAALTAMAVLLALGACKDVPVPIGAASAVKIPFDESVPRRRPGNVHTYRLEAIVPRDAVRAIAEDQLYTYVHVTRCAGGELIAVAETRLDMIDLMDFEALGRKLDQDSSREFRLEAKFSSPTTLRTGEACVAFNGGSYMASEASSRPIPITMKSGPDSGI